MFIDKSDVLRYIDELDTDQLTNEEDTIIEEAILDALAFVKSYLAQRYDVEGEYLKTGNDRDRVLLKNTITVAVFYLCERIPTNQMPTARTDAYERTIDYLKAVASGKVTTDLDEKISPTNEDGYTIKSGGTPKQLRYKF